MATVKLFGNLRSYVTAPVIVVPGATVRDQLQNLCADNAELREAILDGDRVRPFIRIQVNGRDSELAQGLDTPIDDADRIAIFPPIAGG
jgi:molybdopterin synthase sulfur carrier subunit